MNLAWVSGSQVIVEKRERFIDLARFDFVGKRPDKLVQLRAGTERHPIVFKDVGEARAHFWSPHDHNWLNVSLPLLQSYPDVVSSLPRGFGPRSEVLLVAPPIRPELRFDCEEATWSEENVIDVSPFEHHMIDDNPVIASELTELICCPLLSNDSGPSRCYATCLEHHRVDLPRRRRQKRTDHIRCHRFPDEDVNSGDSETSQGRDDCGHVPLTP